jgi:hypothetical protein
MCELKTCQSEVCADSFEEHVYEVQGDPVVKSGNTHLLAGEPFEIAALCGFYTVNLYFATSVGIPNCVE